MHTYIFIDTNQWIDFYKPETIYLIESLKSRIDSPNTTLLFPNIVVAELSTKRKEIEESKKEIEKQLLEADIIRNFIDDTIDISAINTKIKESSKRFIKQVDDLMSDHEDLRPTEEDIIKSAKLRQLRRLPPGSSGNNIGDEIIWESIIKRVKSDNPDSATIHIISNDNSFKNPLLNNEFTEINQNFTLRLWNNIKSYINNNTDIEDTKRKLLDNLLSSNSYTYSHIILSSMNKYDNWSEENLIDILSTENRQVTNLLNDSDFVDFFNNNKPTPISSIDLRDHYNQINHTEAIDE